VLILQSENVGAYKSTYYDVSRCCRMANVWCDFVVVEQAFFVSSPLSLRVGGKAETEAKRTRAEAKVFTDRNNKEIDALTV
jgi:hypothetical protein